MQYHDLNIYVLVEIFHQYVIFTDDGPFHLMLVCTLWRDLVLSTPLLWSHITINESSPDYQAKVNRAFALSGDLPLTVDLIMPLSTIKPFRDHLLRASLLHIHLSNLIDLEPGIETVRNGDKVMEMMITLLKEADIQYEGSVIWYYRQAPISLSTKRMDETISWGREQDPTNEEIVYLRSPYPVFHTFLATTDAYSYRYRHHMYSTTSLFRHLITMINLRALHLACNGVVDSYRTEPYMVVLPQLSELLFTDPLPHDSSHNWKLLGKLVQWISAPALQHVGITAPVYWNSYMIDSVYQKHCPSILTLDIRPQAECYKWEPVRDALGSLLRIDIEISARVIADDLVLSRLKQDIFQHVSPSAICTIIVSGGSKLPPNVSQGLRCPLNITYTGDPPRDSAQYPTKNNLDTLTFRTSGPPPKKLRLPRCRRLCYTHSVASNIIHHPDSWPSQLEELDSSICSFRDSDWYSARSTYSRLTTVTCTPKVASVLIKQGIPSILQVLTLNSTQNKDSDRSGFTAMANALQKRAAYSHAFGSNLAQLNVHFFPPWFSYLNLLNLLVKRRGQAIISLELPGYPHGSILTSIVSVLNGIPPTKNEAYYTPWRQEVPQEGYYYGWQQDHCTCYNSGFKCYPLPRQQFCNRFIDGRKVSITKDTILV